MRKRDREAKKRHDKYVEDILAKSRRRMGKPPAAVIERESLHVDTSGLAPTSDRIVHVPSRRAVTDEMQLQKEPKFVADEIRAKASRVGPHYNKGAYQYLTPGTSPKEGKRRED